MAERSGGSLLVVSAHAGDEVARTRAAASITDCVETVQRSCQGDAAGIGSAVPAFTLWILLQVRGA
jgi:hypothetical protein